MEGFYGVEVATGGKTKPSIPAECLLRVTEVALPVGTDGPATLTVHSEGKAFVVATLDAHKAIYNVPLDLVFNAHQDITLSLACASSGSVHVTGYVQPADDDDGFFDQDEDEDDDEVEVEGHH